jgi:hypothetical protein
MALSDRVANRFRNVPGVLSTDITDWIAEAEFESGKVADTSTADDNALLYLALSIGFSVIATDAARYFRYTDGEESVDKTMIFDMYSRLSNTARKQYTRALRGGFASATYSDRADASGV